MGNVSQAVPGGMGILMTENNQQDYEAILCKKVRPWRWNATYSSMALTRSMPGDFQPKHARGFFKLYVDGGLNAGAECKYSFTAKNLGANVESHGSCTGEIAGTASISFLPLHGLPDLRHQIWSFNGDEFFMEAIFSDDFTSFMGNVQVGTNTLKVLGLSTLTLHSHM